MTAQDRIKADFDEIARLTDDSGTDRYEKLLLSLVPVDARRVLDVGCGLGRLTRAIARSGRQVVGIDLSPVMIERARAVTPLFDVTFIEGDFLSVDVGRRPFDCVVSAAALHHMQADAALHHMAALIRPGGRLILHDLRRNVTAREWLRAAIAFAHEKTGRLIRTGRIRSPRRVRQAWSRHGAGETYLSCLEARAMADRHFPGATLFNHWLWRYTIVWDKPGGA